MLLLKLDADYVNGQIRGQQNEFWSEGFNFVGLQIVCVGRIRGGIQLQSWITKWVSISFYDFILLGVSINILYPQISDQASIIYDETMRQDRVVINFDLPSEPSTLVAYIEDCRMKLWDYVFPSFFRG